MVWVYYEEIDGEYQPKWVLLKANVSEDVAYYSIEAPYERFYEEDMHPDLTSITVGMQHLIRDSFEEKSFGVNVATIKQEIISSQHDPKMLELVEYFILLCDDLQELMALDIQERFQL